MSTTAADDRLDDTEVRRGAPLLAGRAGQLLGRIGDAFLGSTADPAGTAPVAPSPSAAPSLVSPAASAPTVARRGIRIPSSSPWTATALTVLYAVVGFLGVLVVVASAPVWRNAATSWRLTVPGIPHPPDNSLLAAVLFIGGLVAMWVGWAGMVGRAERMPGSPERRLLVVTVIVALWALPPLLGTPILSNDVYSYAAQGEMATRGVDPTAVGPYALSRGPFLNAVDPIWRDAPAPYGPVAIELSEWAVQLTGNSPAGAVWFMRLVAALGVAMTGLGVVLLARRHRVPAAGALVLGVGGPLVLLHMVGGSHNDALMMGLLTLGMAAFTARRRVLAVVLVTLAVAVKLPAIVALAFIGWNWRSAGSSAAADGDPAVDGDGDDVSILDRIRTSAIVGAASGGLLIGLMAAAGIGFGWLTALSNTGSVTSTFSVSTKLGLVASDLATLAGLGVAPGMWLALFRALGLAVAAAACLWLLIRSPRIGVVRATGLAMVVSVLLGPVVWPWYLPAGLALLAASGVGRWRPTFLVVVMAASTFVWPTSVDPVQSLMDVGHILGLAFLALIVGLAFVAQRLAVRMSAWRLDRDARRALTAAAHRRWSGEPPTGRLAPAADPLD